MSVSKGIYTDIIDTIDIIDISDITLTVLSSKISCLQQQLLQTTSLARRRRVWPLKVEGQGDYCACPTSWSPWSRYYTRGEGSSQREKNERIEDVTGSITNSVNGNDIGSGRIISAMSSTFIIIKPSKETTTFWVQTIYETAGNSTCLNISNLVLASLYIYVYDMDTVQKYNTNSNVDDNDKDAVSVLWWATITSRASKTNKFTCVDEKNYSCTAAGATYSSRASIISKTGASAAMNTGRVTSVPYLDRHTRYTRYNLNRSYPTKSLQIYYIAVINAVECKICDRAGSFVSLPKKLFKTPSNTNFLFHSMFHVVSRQNGWNGVSELAVVRLHTPQRYKAGFRSRTSMTIDYVSAIARILLLKPSGTITEEFMKKTFHHFYYYVSILSFCEYMPILKLDRINACQGKRPCAAPVLPDEHSVFMLSRFCQGVTLGYTRLNSLNSCHHLYCNTELAQCTLYLVRSFEKWGLRHVASYCHLKLINDIEPNPGPDRSVTLNVLTLNCRGLGNIDKFRLLLNKLYNLARKGPVVALLQETMI
jgi:hypothetical protein